MWWQSRHVGSQPPSSWSGPWTTGFRMVNPPHLKPRGGGRAVAELAEGVRLLSPPLSGKRKAHRTRVFRWLMPQFPDMWRAGLPRRLCVRLCTARGTWRRECKRNPRSAPTRCLRSSPHMCPVCLESQALSHTKALAAVYADGCPLVFLFSFFLL